MLKAAHIPQSRRSEVARAASAVVEQLEGRQLLSAVPVNVLDYRYNIGSSGVNSNEVQLTPANVKVGSFGKIGSVTLDSNSYAEPLVDTGVTIAAGVNTTAGAAAVHNVVFVATENDSVYALDTATGATLWHRSFLNTSNSGGDQNNPLGATALTSPTDLDVGLPKASDLWGITGTPVIDSSTNLLYVDVRTKEIIGGVAHFIQRLHALRIADGTDATTPFVIGDTVTSGGGSTETYTNNTPIYVYGTGVGSTTDPYNKTGKQVVQFNALRELERAALNLENGQIYVTWASNGDNGPYHGFIASFSVANITTSGFKLTGVLCTSPNDTEAGIWQSGGALAFEPDGSAFYAMTGNGSGGSATLGANKLPTNANYNESVIKVEADSTTTPSSQNPNGWGLKVVDFFQPYNVEAMDNADSDFGSGAPLLLPASAGISGHPNLLVAGGKDGRLYVLDRDNLGEYHLNDDHALNSVENSSGAITPPSVMAGTLSTPVYYNAKLYAVSGYQYNAKAFTISSTGQLVSSSNSANKNFGTLPGGPTVSSSGTSDGIVWLMNINTQDLEAYDASTLSTLLWTSNQAAGGTDTLGAAVKFAEPTIANGEVFVGTQTGLVIYGLTPPAGAVPKAPVPKAAALSASSINLTWTDPTTAPNTATGYLIQQSTDDKTFKQVTTAPAGATSIAIGGLAATTTYYFRVVGYNIEGNSGISNVVASAKTLSGGGTSTGVSPNAPTGLGATPASATSVYLTWTANSTNETGYHLDRATNAGFTQNLITENLPAGISSYTDIASGIAPGLTFYYRLRAYNTAGDSGNSNPSSASIPNVPPKPTEQSVTAVTTDEIDMEWQDNAGHLADGYRILRAEDNGAFTDYEDLPPTSAPAPSEYVWDDTSVTPGNYYEYHIEAYNVSGNDDFAGVNATTITLPPSGVVATATTNAVNLSWAPVTGAVSYKIYRGTTAGGESATPLATGVTAAPYPDNSVTPGVKYYYEVTAVNGNAAYTPPLPSESARSAETSATPGASTANGILTNSLSIGTGLAGSTSFANGVYTISGSGTDIWGTSDGFEYGYSAVTGDTSVIAQVNSVQNTAVWAKAGVMIRSSTAANSVFADLVVTPAGYVSFDWRLATGQVCQQSTVTLGDSPPQWVKLVRTGNAFTAFYSANGANWTALGAAVTISMPASATAGLAVTSLSTTKLCTATFSSVSIGSLTSTGTTGSLFTNNLSIGTGLAGSSSYSNGVYTVNGSGTDIWNTSDGFEYDYNNVSGDTTIVAQVNSVQYTNAWAKAGVMIRTSTAANSAYADLVVTPAGYVSFDWRLASGQASQQSTITLKNSPPQWVKLVRTGNAFTAFYSSNGMTWTALGAAVTIAMPTAATAGLAVSSLSTTALCAATFSNVSINGTGTVTPPSTGGFNSSLSIGTGLTGSSSFSNGTYTVAGSGTDIWGASDGFEYDYYNAFSGDATIVAQVDTVQYTNAWAKAGVMFRSSTAANSAFADLVVTPAGYVSFDWRLATGQTCQQSTITLKNSPPQWVKLVRTGNSFTAFYSSNGTTWTAIGAAVTISMPTAATVGLAVTSLSTTQLCTGTFSNVALTS